MTDSGNSKPKRAARKPVVRRGDEKPFSPAARAGEHREAKGAAKGARGGSRPRGASSGRRGLPAKQAKLPFGEKPSLLARMRPQAFTRRLLHLAIGLLATILLLASVMATYSLSHGIPLFRVNKVRIEGNNLLSEEAINKIVQPMLTQGALRADLPKIRQTLLAKDLIDEVTVARLLPDTIRIVVTERQPVGLARRSNGSVACVDAAGHLFGTAEHFGKGLIPPLINGLREDESPETASFNSQRIVAYQELMADLDRTEPHLSPRIDEVFFDDVDGIRVILSDSRIAVYLGTEQYRQRLNSAFDVLDAAARRDLGSLGLLRVEDAQRMVDGARIAYLNTRIPRRVIVGFK